MLLLHLFVTVLTTGWYSNLRIGFSFLAFCGGCLRATSLFIIKNLFIDDSRKPKWHIDILLEKDNLEI
jgi:Uri superfamily endonuclease